MVDNQYEAMDEENGVAGISDMPWEKADASADVLKDRIRMLESALENKMAEHSGEAGGLAWVNLYTQLGAEITLSARSTNPTEALLDLVGAIKFGVTHAKLSTARPAANLSAAGLPNASSPVPGIPAQAPAPAGADAADNGTGGEVIDVKSVALAFTKRGDAYLKVKGGKYSQFGVNAYDRSLPPAIKDSIRSMFPNQGVDYAAPLNLQRCVVILEDGHPKVSHFIQQ